VVLRSPAPVSPPAEGDAEGAPADPFPPARMDDLRRLVETAIGFDAGRGDAVTILAQPFAIPETALDAAPAMDFGWVPGALREVLLIAIIAIVGLGFVRPLLMRQSAEAAAAPTPGGPTMVEVGEGETLDEVGAKLERRHRDLASSVLGGIASRGEKQAVLRQLVNDDPQRIAQVFRRMMKPELESQG
jgi:flagellar M-ring protein FliF